MSISKDNTIIYQPFSLAREQHKILNRNLIAVDPMGNMAFKFGSRNVRRSNLNEFKLKLHKKHQFHVNHFNDKVQLCQRKRLI